MFDLLVGYWIGWLPALVLPTTSALIMHRCHSNTILRLFVTVGWSASWWLALYVVNNLSPGSAWAPRFDEGDSSSVSDVAFALAANALAGIFVGAALLLIQGVAWVRTERQVDRNLSG